MKITVIVKDFMKIIYKFKKIKGILNGKRREKGKRTCKNLNKMNIKLQNKD